MRLLKDESSKAQLKRFQAQSIVRLKHRRSPLASVATAFST
jgi:hypothetical protein